MRRGGTRARLWSAWRAARRRRVLAFAALASAAVVAFVAGDGKVVATAHGQTPATTVVSLTFDDAPATQWAVRDTLRSHGMRATFYVNSGLTSEEPGGWRMTWSQLRDLAADGHEITGHTLTHSDLTLMTSEQQRKEICDDRTNLLGRGFTPTVSLAYPYGSYNDSAKAIAQECGYSSGRTVGGIRSSLCTGCPFAETIPPADPFVTRTPPDIRDTTSLAQMQSYVTQAEQNGGGWVQIVLHHICADCGEYATTLEQLSAFLDWLQPRAATGTVVKTVGEVMGGSTPPPPPTDTTPPTTTIACNSAACGSGWFAAPVTVTLSASDAGGSGVAETRYTTDGSDPTAASTLYAGSFSVASTSVVRFRSWDNAGNAEAVRSQQVQIDTAAPTVSITSPADGTSARRQGTITIAAGATDAGSGVASVAFYVDGELIGTSTSSPYRVSWKTNRWSRGQHVLTAVATDGVGRATTSAPVRVTLT